MKRPWYLCRPVVWSIIVCFLFGTFAGDVAWARATLGPVGDLSYGQAQERLAVSFRRLKEFRAAIDETDFNPDALAQSLGPELEALYAFVRDEIAYQPYAGVLRFAEGTLMSRAGNACDQSLLLARLLRAHGYEVRFARAELGEEAARRLVAGMNRPEPSGSRAAPKVSADDPLIGGLRLLGLSEEEIEAERRAAAEALDGFLGELSDSFAADQALLEEALEGAGVAFDARPNPALEELVAEARDHCWVQVARDSAWLDLDPSLQSLAPGARLTDPASVSDSLPIDLAYSLHFAISIEQLKNGERLTHNVLDETVPLTNALNTIGVMTLPEATGGSASAELMKPEVAQKFDVVWPAVRVNGVTLQGNPFNLEGEPVSTDVDTRLATEMRETIGGVFGGATDLLGGLLEEETAPPPAAGRPKLVRVDLSLTMLGPDGRVKAIEREIARRPEIADDEVAALELRRELLSRFEIIASATRVTQQFIVARYLDHLLANRGLFFVLLGEAYGQPVVNRETVYNKEISEYPFETLDFAYLRAALMEFNQAAYFPDLAAYFAEPQMVAFRQGFRLDEAGEPVVTARYDVMLNGVRALEAGQPAAGQGGAARFRFEQGTLDTLIEYFLLGGADTVNAHAVMVRAREAGIPLVVVTEETSTQLAEIALDEGSLAAMARDLDNGFVVIAPKEPVTIGGAPAFAWWRVDPASGETLGLAGAGEGQAFKEYMMTTFLPWTVINVLVCGGMTAWSRGGWSQFGICMAISTAFLFAAPVLYRVGLWIVNGAGRGLGLGAGAGAAGAGALGSGAGSGRPPPPGGGRYGGVTEAPPRPSGTQPTIEYPAPRPTGTEVAGTPGGGTGGRPQPTIEYPPGWQPGGGTSSGGTGSGGVRPAPPEVAGLPPEAPAGGATGPRPTIEYPPPRPPGETTTPHTGEPGTPQPGAGGGARPPETPTTGQPERPTIEYPKPPQEVVDAAGPYTEPFLGSRQNTLPEGYPPEFVRAAQPGEPMRLDPNLTDRYLYVTRPDGSVTYAPQSRTGNPDAIKHTMITGSGEGGTAGEIIWRDGAWHIDTNSGRYGQYRDPATGDYGTRTRENLDATVDLLNRYGGVQNPDGSGTALQPDYSLIR